MKVLIIGKTGQLGHELLRIFAEDNAYQCLAPDRSKFELSDPNQMRKFLENERPNVVINTAAFHNVPLCESDWQSAFQINAIAVRELSQICKDINARFVTFSTDYVFSGDQTKPYSEEDRAFPLQTYGNSKLAGENFALSIYPEAAFVIRTCGVYGHTQSKQKGWNFIEQRIRDAEAGKTQEISSDQIVAPTYAVDLATATKKLIDKFPVALPGIYHFANSGSCTWFDFTVTALQIAGIPNTTIPIDRGGRSGNMRRPKYSVLENAKGKHIGIELPSWQDALKRYLAGRKQI